MIGVFFGQDSVYELKLNNDFIFNCTLNHNWLTDRGYVETQYLCEEDFIISYSSKKVSCKNLDLTPIGFMPVACVMTVYDNFTAFSTISNTSSITGNCSYGAMPKKVAKTIGASEEVGKLVHEAFWNAALPLAELKKNLERYWESIGQRKFILGLDGRKIPTRSKSALINYLFQSAGVICTKRAAVIHDRVLRARGLLCDFWIDDWRTKTYAQQLIHYHFDFMVAL